MLLLIKVITFAKIVIIIKKSKKEVEKLTCLQQIFADKSNFG